jgi:putative phosphoesterase
MCGMIPAVATGLLYDVHGNLPALEAVLRDAASTPVERWVLGGDYASFGAWPEESVARLEQLDEAVWIRGNWDRWQAGDDHDMPDVPALREAREAVIEALGADVVARLGALPETYAEDQTLFCHGTPHSDMDAFFPSPQDGDAAQLQGVTASLVVFGHTHLAFTREHDGTTLLNPGSVGMPFDHDTRASWAVLHDDGRIEIRRVAYDVESAIAALTRRFSGSWIDGGVERLRTASFT